MSDYRRNVASKDSETYGDNNRGRIGSIEFDRRKLHRLFDILEMAFGVLKTDLSVKDDNN